MCDAPEDSQRDPGRLNHFIRAAWATEFGPAAAAPTARLGPSVYEVCREVRRYPSGSMIHSNMTSSLRGAPLPLGCVGCGSVCWGVWEGRPPVAALEEGDAEVDGLVDDGLVRPLRHHRHQRRQPQPRCGPNQRRGGAAGAPALWSSVLGFTGQHRRVNGGLARTGVIVSRHAVLSRLLVVRGLDEVPEQPQHPDLQLERGGGAGLLRLFVSKTI